MTPPRTDYPVRPSPTLNRFSLAKWGPWNWAIISGALLAMGLPLMALRTIVRPQPYQPQQSEKAAPAQAQVAALGRIEPEGGRIDVGIPLGSIVQTLLVTDGDTVDKNQVLAYLNGYDEQLANRDLMASQLTEAERQLQSNAGADQAEIEAAAVQLAGVGRPQTSAVVAQEATLRQRVVDYNQAQVELARSQQLFQKGAITRQDYEQQQTRVNELGEQINQAQANLTQLNAARQNDIANAAAQLNVAQAGLERTLGQNQIASARQQLALAEAKLETTIIRAPKAGEVLRVLTHTGESAIDNGMGAGTLLQLGNTRQMYAVAEVYESDASLVKLNQDAIIVSRNNAFEGELKGTVDSIGRQIFKNNLLNDDPAALDDARVVEVKIRLYDGGVVAALTNLQVDVRIDVESDPVGSSEENSPSSEKALEKTSEKALTRSEERSEERPEETR